MYSIILSIVRALKLFFSTQKKAETPIPDPALVETQNVAAPPKPDQAPKTPTPEPLILRNDGWGHGHYQAGRGERKHRGIDIQAEAGQVITCTEPMQLIRHAFPYADDLSWTGAHFRMTDGRILVIYYITCSEVTTYRYAPGEPIGIVQPIAERYNNRPFEVEAKGFMQNHIHIEVRQANKNIEPKIFNLPIALL